MRRPLTLTLALTLTLPAACFADSIILKSGDYYKGKLLQTKDNSYIFKSDTQGEVEVPFSNVYIADFDPVTAPASKGGSVILYSEPERVERLSKEKTKKETPAEAPIFNTSSTVSVPKSRADILKNAQDTVAMSNARAEQINQQLANLKDIADKAN